MYLQVHIISYRYHYRKPNLCKMSYTLTKPYPLHIDMQFIRNICLKIKSDLFLLTISKLCNLNPYTAPLLALFMQLPMARMICTNTNLTSHSFTYILCSAESNTCIFSTINNFKCKRQQCFPPSNAYSLPNEIFKRLNCQINSSQNIENLTLLSSHAILQLSYL